MSERRYWIGVVSQEDADKAVAEGFVQFGFGRAEPLERMQPGDGVTFYSPRTAPQTGALVQAFTAIGRVTDDEPYQVDMTPDFHPFRRNVEFDESVEAQIRPLLDELGFIEDKKRWGYRFRFGLFQIDERDFDVIRAAMTPPGKR